MKIFFLILMIIIGSTLICHAQVLETDNGFMVKNKNPNFTLLIPAGFIRLPTESLPQKTSIYGFKIDDPASAFPMIIGIDRMAGIIGNEPINLETRKKYMPPQAELNIEKFPAMGFDLESVASKFSLQGMELLSLQTELPLKKEAVMITVMGLQEQEKNIRRIMMQVLASVQGETNW